jgi:hypothetical protein
MAQLEKRFKVGACVASIFANEILSGDEKRLARNVVLQKIYRDKEGNFRPTSSLGANDPPKAILVLCKAYDYLLADHEADD